MTPAQLTTLGAYIATVPEWAALPNNSDTAYFIAAELNKPADPAHTVWRNDVTSDETGDAWVGNEITSMSALNMQRLQLLLASSRAGVFDMGRVDRRDGFENPFGGTAGNPGPSRLNMRAVWKRSATVFEKLFATGTGSVESPATMALSGDVSYPQVHEARSL